MNPGNSKLVDRILENALDEDIGPGDITTSAIVDSEIRGEAQLSAKEDAVLAGMEIFSRVFSLLDPGIEVNSKFHDGDVLRDGTYIAQLKGSLRGILIGERTALNFLQHLSGIATLTRAYVDKTKPSQVRVIDTRKTTPGLRLLEKYAVRVGGGSNHRFGLFDGILIKDNHIVAAGSITRAVERVKAHVPHTVRIEVEVTDTKGLEEAISARADAVLLDNMSLEEMSSAVSIAGGRVLLEASGSVTLESIGEIAKTGVDLISVGAITHSARSVDISLEVTDIG
ncbi:MAG: carboxylating nicotinate-nucleotide diphosphorylase [Deltaproteobacteria bacterium]|nr:carboxylating nicotinate-nucleotide diphosphorylase [Deltaproteobacteria bacterium]MBW2078004.1 carboxylating nicotinate-nucleotide diphosphorylase [Deltaproteobacteria bacterium]MBW2311502.1 carboxylating nicotinate-nucleotide diphosphorylase [Deltaproteobacteria bacterium]